MAIDLKKGKQDCSNKYYVYRNKLVVNPTSFQIDDNLVGRIYCKDGSDYLKELTQIGANNKSGNSSALIITYDSLDIKPGWYLYSVDEKKWYFIENVREESENDSQQMSRRPIIKRTISIRGNL